MNGLSWLDWSPHLKSQVLRFLRISGLAFLAALPATGGAISWSSLWALGAGALEAGLRQLVPVTELPMVSAVLADAEKPVSAAPAAAAAPLADPAPPAKG